MNFSFLFTVNAWLCKTPTARGTPPRPVASPWLRSPQPPNLRSSRAFSPDTLINVRITVRHLNSPPRLQLSGTTNISLFLGFSAIVKAKNRTPSSIQPPVETVGKNICFFSFSFLDFVFVVTTTLLAWARFGCVCVCVCVLFCFLPCFCCWCSLIVTFWDALLCSYRGAAVRPVSMSLCDGGGGFGDGRFYPQHDRHLWQHYHW